MQGEGGGGEVGEGRGGVGIKLATMLLRKYVTLLTYFNIHYLVSLLFALLILHPTYHFLNREVFDLLVALAIL